MKIAAVNMDTILGNVNANMDKAKKYIKEAVKDGVELIVFPEFFTSGFAFNRKILGAAQIVDDNGKVVKRKMYNEAAGIIISEVDYNREPKKVEPINTKDYWIPDMPKAFLKYGWEMNEVFQGYYKKVSKPYIIKEMTCK